MKVCEHCFCAIEAHEGRQVHKKIYVDDIDDINESYCEWCEESGNSILYEI